MDGARGQVGQVPQTPPPRLAGIGLRLGVAVVVFGIGRAAVRDGRRRLRREPGQLCGIIDEPLVAPLFAGPQLRLEDLALQALLGQLGRLRAVPLLRGRQLRLLLRECSAKALVLLE